MNHAFNSLLGRKINYCCAASCRMPYPEYIPIEKRTRYRMLSSSHNRRPKKTKEPINRHDCLTKPSVYHAVVVIFLEFFAWGLLTNLNIEVIADTFKHHTFLMNGLIQGVKGILSFLSAPLLGALSDVWGRKLFLLISVAFTCMPIPLLKISPWYALFNFFNFII